MNELSDAKVKAESKTIFIGNEKLHYLEAGTGDPIVFVHGLPGVASMWEPLFAHLSQLGRCISYDMLGFGQSGTHHHAYSYREQVECLTQLIETLKLNRITFVMHGVGSLIALPYVIKHEDHCIGIAFYESFLSSMQSDQLSLTYQEYLHDIKDFEKRSSHDDVERYIREVLPKQLLSANLTELQQYFRELSPVSLRSALAQMPLVNSEMDAELSKIALWLANSQCPKLFMYNLPGFITSIATVSWAKKTMMNLDLVEMSEEFHFAHVAHPDLFAEAISAWYQGIQSQ